MGCHVLYIVYFLGNRKYRQYITEGARNLQPFNNRESIYTSTVWPEVSIHSRTDHLLLKSKHAFAIIGNAIFGEQGHADHIVNWKVSKDLDCTDPVQLMINQFRHWDYPAHTGTGLMTAANLHRASIQEEAGNGYRLLCCVTAGTGNAARSGTARPTYEDVHAGTINIILLMDVNLTPGARINAIMTATEAKAAALQDEQVRDHLTGDIATGTTSDAIVLGMNEQSTKPAYRYAGTVTPIGNAIGRLVYLAVREAVAAQ